MNLSGGKIGNPEMCHHGIQLILKTVPRAFTFTSFIFSLFSTLSAVLNEAGLQDVITFQQSESIPKVLLTLFKLQWDVDGVVWRDEWVTLPPLWEDSNNLIPMPVTFHNAWRVGLPSESRMFIWTSEETKITCVVKGSNCRHGKNSLQKRWETFSEFKWQLLIGAHVNETKYCSKLK